LYFGGTVDTPWSNYILFYFHRSKWMLSSHCAYGVTSFFFTLQIAADNRLALDNSTGIVTSTGGLIFVPRKRAIICGSVGAVCKRIFANIRRRLALDRWAPAINGNQTASMPLPGFRHRRVKKFGWEGSCAFTSATIPRVSLTGINTGNDDLFYLCQSKSRAKQWLVLASGSD